MNDYLIGTDESPEDYSKLLDEEELRIKNHRDLYFSQYHTPLVEYVYNLYPQHDRFKEFQELFLKLEKYILSNVGCLDEGWFPGFSELESRMNRELDKSPESSYHQWLKLERQKKEYMEKEFSNKG